MPLNEIYYGQAGSAERHYTVVHKDANQDKQLFHHASGMHCWRAPSLDHLVRKASRHPVLPRRCAQRSPLVSDSGCADGTGALLDNLIGRLVSGDGLANRHITNGNLYEVDESSLI